MRSTRSRLAILPALLALILGAGTTARAQDGDFAADTRAYLAKLEKLGFAGVVLVARTEAPILAEGYGLADRERGLRWTPATVSDLGSITKQFTAAAILALEEQGRLKVEDSLVAYFPQAPADKRAITLHQLLTHSSGILDLEGAGDWDSIGRDEFVRRTLAQPLAFPPGTGYDYSNAGYSLLGAIIEQLTGASWEQFARTRLFLPQGMYETGYMLPSWGEARMAQGYRGDFRWGTTLERPMDRDGPYWALRANGGVHATAYDMLRWAEALLDGRVLAAASMDKLWAPHVKEPGDTHYGYGWSIAEFGGTKVVTHNGGNGIHFADFAIVPAARTVVFLQNNVIAHMPVGNQLLGQIGARLIGNTPYPSVPDIVAVSGTELSTLAGSYQLPGGMGALRITAEEHRLVVEAIGQRAFTLLHSSRRIDEARAARLATRMDRIAAAILRGDFEPMRQARGDDVPVARLEQRHAEWLAEQEPKLGKLVSHEVLGTAFQEGRDLTVVRFRFERGSADRAYVWDAGAGARLVGISGRGLPSQLGFVPTGTGQFASWDGGRTPSRALVFAPGPDGRMRAVIGSDPASTTAVR